MNIDTFLAIAAGILVIVISLMAGYLRKLPDRLHEEGVKRLEFSLEKQLEGIRASFSRELELLKISQSELQIHKNAELINLAEFFTEVMTNSKKYQTIASRPAEHQELKRKMFDLGVKLFFFTSDETVRAFTEWRKYGHTSGDDPRPLLKKYAELMVLIRKEVGHADTQLTWDDYLAVVLVDWETFRETMTDL